MTYRIKYFVSLLLLYFICQDFVFANSIFVPIVPKPQIIEHKKGYFPIDSKNINIRLAVDDSSDISLAVNQLKQAFQFTDNETHTQNLIWLGLPAENKEFERKCGQLDILPQDHLGGEGYVLLIQQKEIVISAHTNVGLFYGVQSLKQLIRGRQDENRLSCMKIIDFPRFKYRGLMDDISRGPVPTLDFMKQQIRRLAELKINLVSYYIEHVVETTSHGDFAPSGGAITIDEWKELSEYAAQYHIQLMGNFQSLAHFEKIMAYPQYRSLGETDRMISPAFPATYEFLEDIYDEMIPAFSAPFFNVNCDETWDLGRGASKPLVDSLGVARVYADHINRLNKIVQKHGMRMMIWGDIILQHPEILDWLAGETIVGAWDYGAHDSFTQFLKPFKKADFDFMVSPGVLNSNRMMPDFKMTFTNIKNFVRDAADYEAIGILNTAWDDGGKALFSLDWYGVAYAADHAWNPNQEMTEQFNQRFDRGIYGNTNHNISQAIQQLTRLTDLAPTYEMNEQIFWKKLIPNRGEKGQLSLNGWDEVLQIAVAAQQLLKQAQPALYQTDLNSLQFTIQQYRFLATARQEIVGATNNYKTACLLQQDNRCRAREQLITALDHIGKVRDQLEELRDDYRIIYLLENRMYWLDHVLRDYDQTIDDLKDTENLIMAAVADFDKGHYLPPPDEVRLSIDEAEGQYFQYWLLCGPFPNVNWQGRKIDYLKSMGGELRARPIPGQKFESITGESYRWFKYSSPFFSHVNLASVFEQNINVLAYVYCQIESPTDQSVRATLGSNDGIEVICNSDRIYVNHVKRALFIDEDEIHLPLKKGKNHILLKIDQKKGGWGFSFRLPDKEVRNHKHKYSFPKP